MVLKYDIPALAHLCCLTTRLAFCVDIHLKSNKRVPTLEAVIWEKCCHITTMTAKFLISPVEIYEYAVDSAVNQKTPEKPDIGGRKESVYSLYSRSAS